MATVQSYVGPLPILAVVAYVENAIPGSFTILPPQIPVSSAASFAASAPGAVELVQEVITVAGTVQTLAEPEPVVNRTYGSLTVGGGGGGTPPPSTGQLYPLGRN